MSGRTRNGVPGATPMPWAARATTAARSSSTPIHRLMPSVPVTSTPWSTSTSRDRPAPFGVGGAGGRQRGGGRRVDGSARAAPTAGSGWTSRARAGGGSRPRSRRRRRRRRQRGAGRARGSWRSCGCARCVRAARCRRWSAAPRRSRWRGRPRRRASARGRSDVGDRLGPPRRHRHAGGVLRPRLEDHGAAGGRSSDDGAQLGDVEALVVDVDADDVAASRSSRSSIGGNPGCSTTTRSPRRSTTLGDAVEGVEGAVDDRDRLRRERPRRSQLLLERREHGVVEVARRQRLAADLGDDRARGRAAGRGRACPTRGRGRSAPGPR